MAARTYRTPMRTDVLTLLAELAGDDRLVHVERIPARAARFGELAEPLPARRVVGLRRCPASGPTRPRPSTSPGPGGRSSWPPARRRASRSATRLPIAEAVAGPPPGHGAAALPDQGAGPGPAPGAHRPRRAGPGGGHLRRRHRRPRRAPGCARNANVVLTNPEMLHDGDPPLPRAVGDLPAAGCATSWSTSSTCCGASSARHVAHLLRRLRRLCAPLRRRRRRSCSRRPPSATRPAWPRSCAACRSWPVTDDGSPRGERLLRALEPAAARRRRPAPAASTNVEVGPARRRPWSTAGWRTVGVLPQPHGHRGRWRPTCAGGSPAGAGRRRPVATAAATWPPSGARSRPSCSAGRLRGVVATNALELGIDIGGLDACVLNGFPGTIASMWQQAGRAGRGERPSVAVLVAGDDQLDQWLMAHPDEVFTRPPEPAVINPANPCVLLAQLACAAYEQPLAPRRRARGGATTSTTACAQLVARRPAAASARRRRPTGSGPAGWPAPGHRPAHRARPTSSASPTADGTPRRHGRRAAGPSSRCTPARSTCTWASSTGCWRSTSTSGPPSSSPSTATSTPRPAAETDVTILGADDQRDRSGRADAVARRRSRSPPRWSATSAATRRTGELLGAEELDLPPSRARHPGVLVHGRRRSCSAGAGVDAAGGARHPARRRARRPSASCRCSRSATAGTSAACRRRCQAETGLPTIVIYDGYPGGAGIAELGLRRRPTATWRRPSR